jgi:hypothetical protein
VIEANLIPSLVTIIKTDGFSIQKEAAWAISNALTNATDDQIRVMIGQNVIVSLCGMLNCMDTALVLQIMDGLEAILRLGKKASPTQENQYAQAVEKCGGLDSLEALQRHDNETIYDKSVKILTNYFESQAEDTTPAAATAHGPTQQPPPPPPPPPPPSSFQSQARALLLMAAAPHPATVTGIATTTTAAPAPKSFPTVNLINFDEL